MRKHYMIISVDAEKKHLLKLNIHSLKKKILSQLEVEGNFLNLKKDTCENPTANTPLSGEGRNASPKTKRKARTRTSAILLEQCTEDAPSALGQEHKGHRLERKLSPCTDDNSTKPRSM